MKPLYLLSILLFTFLLPVRGQESSQLNSISKEEINIGPVFQFPPPAPVRTMAEWEEVQAVLISWKGYPTILKEIVRHSVEECQVVIFAEYPDMVEGYLEFQEIPLDNVTILTDPYNTVWIRDYGPWSVYHRDVDSLMLVDWEYNRLNRPLDNQIPVAVADHFELPLFQAEESPYTWIHAGGNNLRDGMGSNLSSTLVLEENPGLSEEELDEIAFQYLGAYQYIKLPDLEYDSNHHLDMHMRFIDEETIIVGEYPEGVADGPQIEANLEYLMSEVQTYFGNEFRIIRIPMPPSSEGAWPDEDHIFRTYTNALFVNKTILVPVYGLSSDTIALDIYKAALPGYNVVGINCESMIDNGGAIHCITKLVGVKEPLWIAHARLRDIEEKQDFFPVEAIIKHRSGIAEARLYYRLEGEEMYESVAMTLSDSSASVWYATIPAQPLGSVVEYYIYAQAHDGKEQVRPMVAPEGFFRFAIGMVSAYENRTAIPGLTFRLSPNPSDETTRLHLVSDSNREINVGITDTYGKLLQKWKYTIPAGESEWPLYMDSFPEGMYLIIVREGLRQMSEKLILIH